MKLWGVKPWDLIRSILFSLDAENAHRLTLLLIRLGIRMKNWPLILVSGERWVSPKEPNESEILVFGMKFRSRVGLAAGFDKNAEILLGLPALGFGFVEIGTVTPRAQPGNDRPRLFRDPGQSAIFNRMGFNGLGASLIAERLRKDRENLPINFRVGVNLGKNKDTPLEKASDDFVRAASAFKGLADYLVINVSSPNTAGLRSLQTLEALKPILGEVGALISSWKKTPLLLKLAPELNGLELSHLIQSIEAWDSRLIDGWVLTNTFQGDFSHDGIKEAGGWSGRPLAPLSRRSLVEARRTTRKPIISVGGIFSTDEALDRISQGADLIQIYTGWIYQGPGFPRALKNRIQARQ